MLKKNSLCYFEVDRYDTVTRHENPCMREMRYRSVIGFGRDYFVKDYDEKKKGLNCIMRHYGGGLYQFSDDEIRNVCVIRIDIESMSEKNTIEG